MTAGSAIAALISVGLLMHESVYVASHGFRYFTDTSFPVFALRTNKITHALIHISLMSSSLVFALFPFYFITRLAIFLSVVLLIATFPRRLPNHLALAVFFVSSFVAARMAGASDVLVQGLIQWFTIMVYVLSGFHKLNRLYFSRDTSCGCMLVIHYLMQKQFITNRIPRGLYLVSVWVVVLLELTLPMGLLFEQTRSYAIPICVLLHGAFGFLAHTHFSIMMMAGLFSFFPDASFSTLSRSTTVGLGFAVLGGVVLGFSLGNHNPYRARLLGIINHVVFGSIFGVVLWFSLSQFGISQLYPAELESHWLVGGFLLTLFAFNGMGPYIGWKQEFSFAMFSNLRPDRWSHFVVRRRWFSGIPRYVTVVELTRFGGDPSRGLAMFEGAFPYRGENCYSIGYVLDRLQNIQKETGIHDLAVRARLHPEQEFLVIRPDANIKLFERFSFFPYMVPVQEEVPLCT